MNEIFANLVPLGQSTFIALLSSIVTVYAVNKTHDVDDLNHRNEIWKKIENMENDQDQFKRESKREREHVVEIVSAEMKMLGHNIQRLTEEVRDHNQLVDRMYLVEKKTDIHDERIKNLERKVCDD
jgi:uncharacterized protein Yka (UPF0111/DUF47 family)